MKIRLYLLQTICSKSSLWSWRGDSVAEALDYYPRHLFQAQLFRQSFPVAVPCLFLLAGQKSISPGQNGKGTERRDITSGTERLGSLCTHFRIIIIIQKKEIRKKISKKYYSIRRTRGLN